MWRSLEGLVSEVEWDDYDDDNDDYNDNDAVYNYIVLTTRSIER